MVLYTVLILISLEVLVRVFHLTKDYPDRYVDEHGVEKWLPNQNGYSVTGNRRQNFSEYHINSFGYNSYREFKPSKDKVEIALVGDSFIEGFHQNYYNSIGRKIENRLDGVEVYEYGYAGYDFADQIHLINKYKEQFDLIDFVILGLKFENDLKRNKYTILEERMKLESPLYKTMRQSKLLVYLQTIGLLETPRMLLSKVINLVLGSGKNNEAVKEVNVEDENNKYIVNFISLINAYGFDKNRFVFLLNEEKTPEMFLDYLNYNGYKYLDFGKTLKNSKRPTNLIYDMHWNNHGRTLIAESIANYVQKQIYN